MPRWATSSPRTRLTDLPSEGRDPVAILSLQPGVTYIGNTTNDPAHSDSRGGAVNGARSDQTNITLDGLDDNDQLEGYGFRRRHAHHTRFLQEFRVTTSNSDADYRPLLRRPSHLVTKSGTNKVHGSVYEYYRPTLPLPTTGSIRPELQADEANTPPFLLRNTFGGTLAVPLTRTGCFSLPHMKASASAKTCRSRGLFPVWGFAPEASVTPAT